GIFEVFFDTIVVCSVTSLVILTTGVWQTDASVSTLTIAGFQKALGPVAGGFIVSLSLTLFCFTTAVAQTLFACDQLVKIFGEKAGTWGKYVYLGLMFIG
ncbi:alanine:cation symporter family protein, partial [[Clostridium] symbiosum]|uniref:alanine:cation symporter family protein n=1 Tax=Clostridium symbiosum TaxID=1512 RepID=UPI00210C0A66